MEPIRIEIEIGLKQSTLNVLEQLARRSGPEPRTPERLERKSDEPVESKSKPTQEVKAEQKPTEPEELDIPDERLREAVKAAKDATSAADVRTVFKDFGIRASIDCPAARRRELLERLTTLAS